MRGQQKPVSVLLATSKDAADEFGSELVLAGFLATVLMRSALQIEIRDEFELIKLNEQGGVARFFIHDSLAF